MAQHEKAERAKIFAPFDALRGLREALAEKERITVPRMILTDEKKEELDRMFQQISPRDVITVVYFSRDEYVQVTGMVSKFSPTSKTMQIVNTKISFDDVCDIKINDSWEVTEKWT